MPAVLPALLLCSISLFACPSEKSGCDTAAVTNVAAKAESKDCATPCSGEQVAVQNVALKADSKDCATPCSGDKAAVRNVALTTDAEDCATPCSGEKAAVQNVVMTTDAKDCATACSDEKMAACDSPKGFATPTMAFQVGDKSVACPVSAKAMAAESKSDMKFVVEGVAYATEGEAKLAHMIAMERFNDSLTRVALVVNGEKIECAEMAAACADACESTKIQYQVGPAMFDNAEDAVRAAAAAFAAMQSVKMTYAVNGEATNCSVDAKAKSASCGSPVQFVVNGAATPCDQTAKYLLTRERMAAAVAAVQKTIG
jgi:hypothetical protein